jgi:Zn finger protein HypA/HybF involved in hydrogenase expression
MRLIDADALRRRKELRFGLMAAITTIQFLIDEAPTVEERKHGHWLTKKAWHVECSECHHVLEFICDVKKYCPNCGAKMDGE